jgi:hypothetical protein
MSVKREEMVNARKRTSLIFKINIKKSCKMSAYLSKFLRLFILLLYVFLVSQKQCEVQFILLLIAHKFF